MADFENNYAFAGVPFHAHFHYDLAEKRCRDYVSAEEPLFALTIGEEDMEAVRQDEALDASDALCEFLALYASFCDQAIRYDTFMFHSSAIAVDGKAYLFTAPSGTGKSTHTRLWRELLGDRVHMINDDKPLLKYEKDTFVVYGTPWTGKHRIGNNSSAPLGGICFLDRGEENRIKRAEPEASLPLLLRQIYLPEKESELRRLLDLVYLLARKTPLWHMNCTISKEAAQMSFQAMTETTEKGT